MIGYYVHHHGRGHLNRALAITRHLDEQVTFLSSLARPDDLDARHDWLALPMDTPAGGAPAHAAVVDATANGRLHWAPLHVPGLARRHAIIAQFVDARQPRRIVVDVSVEVAMLARLSGVPVTWMGMPGERDDPIHRLALDVADSVIAPWSERVYHPSWLAAHRDRTHFVGSITRFDGRQVPARSDGPPTALLLAGAGGTAVAESALEELQSVAPEFEWVAAGGAGPWLEDPWPVIGGADLVVCHAGQNVVADVAAAGVPAVIIPQDRPFDEQHATASALAAAGIAVTVPRWPAVEEWSSLIGRALALDASRWRLLDTRGAAARAAAVVAA